MAGETIIKIQQSVLRMQHSTQTKVVVKKEGSRGEPGTPGVNGREVELRRTQTAIQWRYVGDSGWVDLILLSELSGGTGGGGTWYKKLVEATGMEAGVISVNGISDATFSEVQQGPRWLDQYTLAGAVPANSYRINANNTITLGTIPEFQELIYIRWKA